MVWENGIYWHYLSSWCQPDSINSSSEEWMRLWALSGRIVPVSCLLFACLPLSVMKTFLLMAGVWEAKPILQFLIAVPQILCSPYSTVKPLFFLPPSKHAFNQLLDLELKSSFKDMLMNAMKEQSVSTGKGWRFNTLWKLFAKQSFQQLSCPFALSTSIQHRRRLWWTDHCAAVTDEVLVLSWRYLRQIRQNEQITCDDWEMLALVWVQSPKSVTQRLLAYEIV